jgi:hypothetical protein
VAQERGDVIGRERVSGRQVSMGGESGKWSTRRGGRVVSCLVSGGGSELTRKCHDSGGPRSKTLAQTPPSLKEECWGGGCSIWILSHRSEHAKVRSLRSHALLTTSCQKVTSFIDLG